MRLPETPHHKPENDYDEQACGDGHGCMQKSQHFTILSNSSLVKLAEILATLTLSSNSSGTSSPDSRYVVI